MSDVEFTNGRDGDQQPGKRTEFWQDLEHENFLANLSGAEKAFYLRLGQDGILDNPEIEPDPEDEDAQAVEDNKRREFFRALKAAYGDDLNHALLRDTDKFFEHLYNTFEANPDFPGHFKSHTTGNIYKVTPGSISYVDSNGKFEYADALEMAKLAALDVDMQREGVHVNGNTPEEKLLLVLAMEEVNKALPQGQKIEIHGATAVKSRDIVSPTAWAKIFVDADAHSQASAHRKAKPLDFGEAPDNRKREAFEKTVKHKIMATGSSLKFAFSAEEIVRMRAAVRAINPDLDATNKEIDLALKDQFHRAAAGDAAAQSYLQEIEQKLNFVYGEDTYSADEWIGSVRTNDISENLMRTLLEQAPDLGNLTEIQLKQYVASELRHRNVTDLSDDIIEGEYQKVLATLQKSNVLDEGQSQGHNTVFTVNRDSQAMQNKKAELIKAGIIDDDDTEEERADAGAPDPHGRPAAAPG